MKLSVFIDKKHEEEIIIYSHEKSKLISDIEELISESVNEIVGYDDKKAVILSPSDIYCFISEDNKIYAVTEKERLAVKYRIYQLEEKLKNNFIKINQSCIANIKKIDYFDASIFGSLTVRFKNGYTDYVSRRNIKKVKERLGLYL